MTLKKSAAYAVLTLTLALTNSAQALGPTRKPTEVENNKGSNKLSKLLGDLPVMMGAPQEGTDDDDEDCAKVQLRSMIRTLQSMSPEARARVIEDLKAAGVRSLEIKSTTPKYDQRIIGERIITMGKAKVTQLVDDINWSEMRKVHHYPKDTLYRDLLRYESQSWAQAEFLPGLGWGREGSWLLDNVHYAILEKAKKLKNESQLKGGQLVITPRSHKYILRRVEYILPPALTAKRSGIHELQHWVDSGVATLAESYLHPDHKPYRQACFSPISVGDLLSAAQGPTEE